MNIRFIRSRIAKVTLGLAVVAGIGSLIAQTVVAADSIAELNGIKPMGAAELSNYRGGFTLPNGLNLDVGVIVDTAVKSAMGSLAVQTVFTAPNSNTPVATLTTHSTVTDNGNTSSGGNSTTTFAIQGQNGVTKVVQGQNGLTSLITNTASNVDIHQSKTINIDVSNYYATMNPVLASKLMTLRIEALNNWKTGLH